MATLDQLRFVEEANHLMYICLHLLTSTVAHRKFLQPCKKWRNEEHPNLSRPTRQL